MTYDAPYDMRPDSCRINRLTTYFGNLFIGDQPDAFPAPLHIQMDIATLGVLVTQGYNLVHQKPRYVSRLIDILGEQIREIEGDWAFMLCDDRALLRKEVAILWQDLQDLCSLMCNY